MSAQTKKHLEDILMDLWCSGVIKYTEFMEYKKLNYLDMKRKVEDLVEVLK